ncbi:hypothetical protein D910_10086, partial [Dendroctonus ponderosae]
FARTCHLNTDGNVVCDCQPGYVGLRCEHCAPGFTGNPLQPGDTCRPASQCDPQGTLGQDADGRCLCKEYSAGPLCNQCQPNTFYLSNRNQFGCIACFCMGVSQQCSSSSWYRDTFPAQLGSVFTSSTNDFRLTDIAKENAFSDGIQLNQDGRELLYSSFGRPEVYYWSLPNKYLGDKVTSYGGFLRYSIRNTPVPGGASSRNNAPDVELVSGGSSCSDSQLTDFEQENNINLQYFSANASQSTNAPQTFVVPLLEQFWQRNDGQKTDREHLLMALADVQAIYIKATYFTNTQEAALISVSLDTATDQNTGRERAFEVEQCHCPPGYTGLSCEDCAFGYTRAGEGIYLELCIPCECNGLSNECDPETGDCRPLSRIAGTTRAAANASSACQALPGIPPGGNSARPMGLLCLATATREELPTMASNVEGASCDRCRNGTFGLSANTIEGCEFCFCSGVSTECSQSHLYLEQIPVQITEEHHFILTDEQFKVTINEGFKINLALNEIGYTFPPSRREKMYWSLPPIFTGNQIKSYGGKLEYMYRYFELPYARYIQDKDIIISGNGVVIYWARTDDLRPTIINSVIRSLAIFPWTLPLMCTLPSHTLPAWRIAGRVDWVVEGAALLIASCNLPDALQATGAPLARPAPPATTRTPPTPTPIHWGRVDHAHAMGRRRVATWTTAPEMLSATACPGTPAATAMKVCVDPNSPTLCMACNIVEVKVSMTPSRVVAPIGQQVAFTCTYQAVNLTAYNEALESSRWQVAIENLDSGLRTKLSDLIRFEGGAQAAFYAVVGCVKQTIRCLILNRNDTVVGTVSVDLVPGLNCFYHQSL